MVALETVTNQYLGGDASLACSAEPRLQIDRKVVEAGEIRSTRRRCKFRSENRAKLDELAHVPLREREPSPARSS